MTDNDGSQTQPVTGNVENAPAVPAGQPIRQLDTIMESLASYATPVLREIAAKAAELAAKAGEAAGPMAQRAADKTEAVGERVAVKGREVAAEMRRDTAVGKSGTGNPPYEPVDQTAAEQESGLPPR
jgi:hypothetical protein